jgi:hypothetical protein
MKRNLTAGIWILALAATGMAAHAQGRRPSGPQQAPTAQRPSIGHVQSPHSAFGTRQQQSEERRLEAEHLRQAAAQRRVGAEEHNQSNEARAEHPPNEQAADEALAAEQNAESSDVQGARSERTSDRRHNGESE